MFSTVIRVMIRLLICRFKKKISSILDVLNSLWILFISLSPVDERTLLFWRRKDSYKPKHSNCERHCGEGVSIKTVYKLPWIYLLKKKSLYLLISTLYSIGFYQIHWNWRKVWSTFICNLFTAYYHCYHLFIRCLFRYSLCGVIQVMQMPTGMRQVCVYYLKFFELISSSGKTVRA